ncbi:hypothetical protein BaRGS_00004577 [Batillaria attramentaria]|uniref:Uncharacterized protein n=1 Tax=Batillaria attramentaria TaxID=370345 RepID=A0ABD0LZ39_9CAEN
MSTRAVSVHLSRVPCGADYKRSSLVTSGSVPLVKCHGPWLHNPRSFFLRKWLSAGLGNWAELSPQAQARRLGQKMG